MSKPLLVFEDLDTTRQIPLFRLLGVQWVATPTAWLSLILFFAPTIALMLLQTSRPIEQRVLFGVGLGAAVYLTVFLHTIGHILGGRLVRAPMDEAIVTATRHVNVYHENIPLPSYIHLSRALGGPVMNLIVAVGLLGLVGSRNLLLQTTGIINLVLALGALAPVPSVDGWIIWRELLRRGGQSPDDAHPTDSRKQRF